MLFDQCHETILSLIFEYGENRDNARRSYIDIFSKYFEGYIECPVSFGNRIDCLIDDLCESSDDNAIKNFCRWFYFKSCVGFMSNESY